MRWLGSVHDRDDATMLERLLLFGLPVDAGVKDEDVKEKIISGRLLMTYNNPLAYHISRKYPDYAANLERFNHSSREEENEIRFNYFGIPPLVGNSIVRFKTMNSKNMIMSRMVRFWRRWI